MNLRRIFVSEPDVIDEAFQQWKTAWEDRVGGDFVRGVQSEIRKRKDEMLDASRKGTPARAIVLAIVSNHAGDEVQTGHHHFFRGQITDHGNELMNAYEDAVEGMVSLGHAKREWADEEIKTLRNFVRNSG